MPNGLPLVYLHGIVPGGYLAMWPVCVIGDAPETLTFSIAIDDAVHAGLLEGVFKVHHDGAKRRSMR